MHEDGLRIGELATLAGVSTRTVRHYERLGVLATAARGTNGYRRYSVSALLEIAEIRRLQDAGLALAEIAALRVGEPIGDRATLIGRLATLEAELDEAITALAARRRALGEMRAGLENGEAVLATSVPSSFGPIDALLAELGVSDRARDEQRRVWSAITAINLPDEWQDAIAVGVAQLRAEPAAFNALAEVFELVASLRDGDPTDERVETVAGRLADLVSHVPSDSQPVTLMSESALPILLTVASCFSAAQVRALTLLAARMTDDVSRQ